MVFLKNIDRSPARGRLLGATRLASRGSSSAWVCVCLAVLGLGGGLAMALLSFNSSEAAPRIAAIPREIIYVPPPGPQSPESNSRLNSADAAALLQSDSRATGNSRAALQAPTAGERPFAASGFELASIEPVTNNFDSAPAEFFAAPNATELTSPIAMFAGNTAAADYAAFSGVAAPVPEPSTWAMMLTGGGVVVAALRRRTRR